MKWVSLNSKSLLVDIRDAQPLQHHTLDWVSSLKERTVHEFLFDPHMAEAPFFVAMLLAKRNTTNRAVVWMDPQFTFYPPSAGVSFKQLRILRPKRNDIAWAAIECLRCRQVGAVIAPILYPPTRVEVRRLQLAAEQGGGMGLLLRPNLASAGVHIYAATTRWLISPAPGERTIQRWRIQSFHGHGGLGQSFILEKHRATGQTNFVPVSTALVNHTKIAAAS